MTQTLLNKISYWIVPIESDRSFFQNIIYSLAEKHHAPVFQPHITIYSGMGLQREAIDLVESIANNFKGFFLKVNQVGYSLQINKTLFLSIQSTELLVNISKMLQTGSTFPSDFVLEPHISLLYKQGINEEMLKEMVTNFPMIKGAIFFDELKAITSPGDVFAIDNVNNWQTIHSKKFRLG